MRQADSTARFDMICLDMVSVKLLRDCDTKVSNAISWLWLQIYKRWMNRYCICHCNDNIIAYVLYKYLSVPTLVCPYSILLEEQHQRVYPLQVTLEIFGTKIKYYLCQKDGVDFVFVSHPSYQRLGIYGDAFGPFKDNQVAELLALSFKSYLSPKFLHHHVRGLVFMSL